MKVCGRAWVLRAYMVQETNTRRYLYNLGLSASRCTIQINGDPNIRLVCFPRHCRLSICWLSHEKYDVCTFSSSPAMKTDVTSCHATKGSVVHLCINTFEKQLLSQNAVRNSIIKRTTLGIWVNLEYLVWLSRPGNVFKLA